jgi:putative endonuclease
MLRRLLARWASRRGDSVWRRGERAAERFLRRRGYRLLARNLRLVSGEIDLLFEEGRCVVLVEVKARVAAAGDPPRLPERAITPAKAKKLARLAGEVSSRRGLGGRPVRVDVVAVDFAPGGRKPLEIRHYPRAIDAAGRRV